MTAADRALTRYSVDAPGCEHATPIPPASRVGPLLASSVIVPFDVGTRDVPGDVDTQVANLFDRAGRIFTAGGAGWDDVARMTFFVTSASSRDVIDRLWTTHFPDPAHRPARMTQIATLPDPMEVQCEFLAVVPS